MPPMYDVILQGFREQRAKWEVLVATKPDDERWRSLGAFLATNAEVIGPWRDEGLSDLEIGALLTASVLITFGSRLGDHDPQIRAAALVAVIASEV